MTAVSSVTAGPFLVQPAAQVLPVLPTAAQPHLALVAILGPMDHVRAQQGGRAHSPAASRGTCMTHCASGQGASLWNTLKSRERGSPTGRGASVCALVSQSGTGPGVGYGMVH